MCVTILICECILMITDDNNNKVIGEVTSNTDSICEAAAVCEPAHGQSDQSPNNRSRCEEVDNKGISTNCKFDNG